MLEYWLFSWQKCGKVGIQPLGWKGGIDTYLEINYNDYEVLKYRHMCKHLLQDFFRRRSNEPAEGESFYV